jgi:hypothetical protein
MSTGHAKKGEKIITEKGKTKERKKIERRGGSGTRGVGWVDRGFPPPAYALSLRDPRAPADDARRSPGRT